MTKEQIERQLKALDDVGSRLLHNKEKSLQFLINAGIIKPEKKESNKSKSTK